MREQRSEAQRQTQSCSLSDALGVFCSLKLIGESKPVEEPLGRQSNLGEVQGLKPWQGERVGEKQVPLRRYVLGDAGRPDGR